MLTEETSVSRIFQVHLTEVMKLFLFTLKVPMVDVVSASGKKIQLQDGSEQLRVSQIGYLSTY